MIIRRCKTQLPAIHSYMCHANNIFVPFATFCDLVRQCHCTRRRPLLHRLPISIPSNPSIHSLINVSNQHHPFHPFNIIHIHHPSIGHWTFPPSQIFFSSPPIFFFTPLLSLSAVICCCFFTSSYAFGQQISHSSENPCPAQPIFHPVGSL